MKKQLIIFLFVILFSTNLGIISLFAQESETQAIPALPESEVQWLWGEVVSVDTLTKQMIVKYLDYETDTEKEITININDKTNFENAKSLDEIKAQDTVSVDYITNPEGKDIAKNISVEKNEGVQILPEQNTQEEP
jgi:hypothetical protein